jgi:hypothetical protein
MRWLWEAIAATAALGFFGTSEFDIDGNLLRSWDSPASVPTGVWPTRLTRAEIRAHSCELI